MNESHFIELKNQIADFTKSRGFDNTDTPKNLSIALSVESAELLENFQWLNTGDLVELSDTQYNQITDEIGDVFIYLLSLSEKLNIDLIEAALNKMIKNNKKYPAI